MSNVKSMAGRRLSVLLDRVPEVTIPRRDWDSPEGEAFIREVLATAPTDEALVALGHELGSPNMVAVVRARQRYLT